MQIQRGSSDALVTIVNSAKNRKERRTVNTSLIFMVSKIKRGIYLRFDGISPWQRLWMGMIEN
jgi:hypothetical protein